MWAVVWVLLPSSEPTSGPSANTGIAHTDTAREAARSRAAAFFVNFIILIRQWGPQLTVSLGFAYSFHTIWFVDPQFSSFFIVNTACLAHRKGAQPTVSVSFTMPLLVLVVRSEQ